MGLLEINNGLLHIMENYLREKQGTFAENDLAIFIRNKITETISKAIHQVSNREFLVRASPGKGNWAEIPWICIFNENITRSAQKGIYLVFLFSADMKKVYLSLNQGFTFYKDNRITDRIDEFSSLIRDIILTEYNIGDYLREIDLNTENNLGKGYESCNIISKLYRIEDLKNPSTDIIEDINRFLNIYDYIYSQLPNKDIDLFYENLHKSLGEVKSRTKEERKSEDKYNMNLERNKMIDHIYDYISSKGFIFEKTDIANLYLSMKTKAFVLMAGISGTGKSKLVELFANAIGANIDNGRYRLISVRPDWNDGTDLFGYIDINGNFIPGMLTEITYEANKDKNLNKPYIVCLDEMNLARVEYYLSDYLSIIETRHRKADQIRTNRIFPEGYFKDENKYRDIYFSDNIIIIGTVNMDDTTFAFSEKVLDRANTIEFSRVDLNSLDFLNFELKEIQLDNENFKTSYLTIKDAINENRHFVERVNRNIIDIHEILKEYDLHFGYRLRDEIVFYMLENNKAQLLDYSVALDFQIMQKILPRISGSDYYIKETLINLFNYLNPQEEIRSSHNYLEEVSIDGSEFPRSSKKIIKMLRSYENGYVSFW